jgi:hypothetical protein
MENSVQVLQKIKNRPTIQSIHTTPGHISKWNISQDTTETLAHPFLVQNYSQ